MARPEDVCFGTGKYKIWKPWRLGDYDHTVIQPEIHPFSDSKIKLIDTMYVTIVDDIGIYGHNVTMVYYLYDFIKEGKVITKTQYINKGVDKNAKTIYYDEVLDEKLGGEKNKIGGQ